MRKNLAKKLFSVALALLMTLSCLPLPAYAEGTGTIPGAPETIQLPASGKATSREENFNEGWKFYLGTNGSAQSPNFDDSKWENVTLPHDFSITQNFTSRGEAESGFLPGGTGWYRKKFTLPTADEGKQILLNFDGVYSDAAVYVNGTLVGENHYGYNNFAFDITNNVNFGEENVVAVKAVNNIPSSRWYSGSGIYRDVSLIVTDPVHVDWNGVKITTPDIASGKGTVNVAVDVKNDGKTSANVTVKNAVYDGENKVAEASASANVAAGRVGNVEASPVVSNPKLWSVENPNLYTVKTEVSVNGEVVDTVENTFGFRYYSFDKNGFHLNGKNVKLNGVCLHHDQGALGAAASYDAMYRQLSIMKDMGVNAIRTSHNPADKHFIDICNELGLLVIEELFDGWVDAKNGNSNDFSGYFSKNTSNAPYGNENMTWANAVVKNIVKRDRNDPSVILWSLGNEVQEGTNWTQVGSYASIAQNLINWIKKEDTTRPTTSGDNNRGGDSRLVDVLNTIRNNGGVVGFNYANSAATLRSLANSYGGGVVIAAETASATNSRGQYKNQNNNSNSDGKYHLTSYDTSSVSWGIPAHDSIYNTYQYDCVAGEFVWTGFDYIGEPTPWNGTNSGDSGRGAIPNSSYFGIVETTGFEKDTYYLYRSQWNKNETTLHLVTAWDSDNMMTTNKMTPVVVYSNAPVVKLYRDGTLIGTATRKENVSSSGHIYYTYTTKSDNTNVCKAVSASGADSLYATFNVTYASGTISAKAFERNGTTEISLSGNSGKNSVTTPDAVSKLMVSQNKREIPADGSSLVYIAVDVTDASGNLDTTASNTINFSLSGNGEIVGVDNGDQATTAKYQQSSVLNSATSANIKAYAGKALVIVRSTKDAGSFTVNVSSSGLTGGSATVTTTSIDNGEAKDGLVSYTMVRDYTVKAGTQPELLTTAAGKLADGKDISGTIIWDAIPDEIEVGDHTVKGALTFAGYESIAVSAKIHVIDNVIAMRNISTATTSNTVPSLPNAVRGVLADGTLSGEFQVTWDAMSENQFGNVGNIVVIHGAAAVFGDETLPVTASIRVGEEINAESTNVAPQASKLEQDIRAGMQSDNLESIRNGVLKPGDNTKERWTNWNNRKTSDKATLTFYWDTAHPLSSVNLYYYYDNCAAKPESVVFEYSLNGNEFTGIDAAEELVEAYSLGAEYAYTFAAPVNPVALRITLTQQDGTSGTHCVGLTECEIMTFAGELEYKSSADLSGISVDDAAIEEFEAETLTYTAAGETVTAETVVNAGITILPVLDDVVRILTVSEDGLKEKTYAVTLEENVCRHKDTEVRDAAEPTCTEKGYTGDTYCRECGELVEQGTDVPAKGHAWGEYVVTKEPTTTEKGEKTRTCSVCGATETVELPMLSVIPKVTVSAEANGTLQIKLIGKLENRGEMGDGLSHGIVYINQQRLGSRSLTVNSAGRTNVSFKGYREDDSFAYTMKAASASTKYVVRAYVTYQDANGRTIYVYSDPIYVSCNTLPQP